MTSEPKSAPEATPPSSPSSRGLREWAGPVLGGLALVVALTGLVSAQRTSQRLVRLEQRVTTVAKAQGFRRALAEPNARKARRRGEGKTRRGKAPAPKDRKSLAERQQEARDEVSASVAAFALDQGLDDQTVGQVLGELEARNDAVRVVFQDLAAGTVSADQAREEVQWVRDESADELRGILGDDELYEALDKHLSERSPRRRRQAMNRGPEDAPE